MKRAIGFAVSSNYKVMNGSWLQRTTARWLCLITACPSLCVAHQCSAQETGGQTAQQSKLESFQAVTIRSTMGGTSCFQTYVGNRLRCGFCSIDMLIHLAYDVQPFQIVGGPDRSRQEGYEIIATPPDSPESSSPRPGESCTPLSSRQKVMIQALLMEQFHLSFHPESRTVPEYILVKRSEFPQLRPAANSTDRPNAWIGLNYLEGRSATMTLLATRLAEFLRRPVIDQTGLEGSFDFKYEWSSSSRGYSDEGDAAIAAYAVGEIGLELVLSRGPVDFIVIDHIESPAPN